MILGSRIPLSGRFENDLLSWERWSSFSENKYLEEVGKCSTPGSIAQKKVYFKAHYKKIVTQKSELMDQEQDNGDKSLRSVTPSLIEKDSTSCFYFHDTAKGQGKRSLALSTLEGYNGDGAEHGEKGFACKNKSSTKFERYHVQNRGGINIGVSSWMKMNKYNMYGRYHGPLALVLLVVSS